MAAFRILNVTAVNGKLVVEVSHFDSDGSTIKWYEEYDFQGRTGHKQKEANADGRPYLDNNELAPLSPAQLTVSLWQVRITHQQGVHGNSRTIRSG